MNLSIILLFGVLCVANASYVLQDNYSGSTFFSNFTFFTAGDPTNGFVQYVSQSTALADSPPLISTSNGQVFIYSDDTNVASSAGRQSIRLTSNNIYNGGLFLFDVAHISTTEYYFV